MAKTRVRSANFNEAEEDILVKCILKHADIIENKKTDGCTLKEKQCAWDKIAADFNAQCPNVARSSKALKDKYTNMKTTLREQFAKEKSSLKKTGGGQEILKWRPKSDAMADLANIIAISIRGTTPCFDDDDEAGSLSPHLSSVDPPAVNSLTLDSPGVNYSYFIGELLNSDNADKENIVPNDSQDKENSASNDGKDNVAPTSDEPRKSWAKYTPAQLRKTNSSKLKRPIPRFPPKQTLQNLKIKLLERELEMREIEHKMRIKEHEAQMALFAAKLKQVEGENSRRDVRREYKRSYHRT